MSYDGFHPLLTVSRTKFCRKCRESNSIPLPLCNVTIERRNCEIYLKMSFTAESGSAQLRVERWCRGRNGISDIRRWEVITAAALDTVIAGYLLHISVLSNTHNT